MTDGGKAPISGGAGIALILLAMFAIVGLIWLLASQVAP